MMSFLFYKVETVKRKKKKEVHQFNGFADGSVSNYVKIYITPTVQ